MTRKLCLGLLVGLLGLPTLMTRESSAGFDSGVSKSSSGHSSLQFAADDQRGNMAKEEKPPGDLPPKSDPPPKRKKRSPGPLPPASVEVPAKK
jgi:hypothetical protein